MLSLEEAVEDILSKVAVLDAQEVPLAVGQDRILSTAQRASWQLPPWDNSAMDGFAVRAAELQSPTELPISGTIAAGATPGASLRVGSCMKIMTGAPMPGGADAVVMREIVTERDGRAGFTASPKVGAHIRRAGEDIQADSELLPAGVHLGPGELAILASQGKARISVVSQPRVAILSTGDELVPLGQTPNASQIISSNNITLAAQVREAGGIPVDAGIVPDCLTSTVRALRSLRDYDVLLTSGGVSVGDFDHVKDAFEEVGIELQFWKVAIKPGKPLAFGIRKSLSGGPSQLVFGLPGNPASSLVSFELFVRPVLRKLAGHRRTQRQQAMVQLEHRMAKQPGRTHFVRASLHDGVATALRTQGSGMLRSMVGVDCLVQLDADKTEFPAGSTVPALIMREAQ